MFSSHHCSDQRSDQPDNTSISTQSSGNILSHASPDHTQYQPIPRVRPSASPIRLQARPKLAAIPLVAQERLDRTWYDVDSGPWAASDLPRVEIVRLDLEHRLLDLPRTWFELRDMQERRILLDRYVRVWKAGTALEFARDPQSPVATVGVGLFFRGISEIKCLQDYPHDWADISDEQLIGLLERAGPAR